MATTNMFGGPVLSGPHPWYSNPAFNQHRMNRSYPAPGGVEDISSALGGMQMYTSTTGPPFGRMHSAISGSFSPGMMAQAMNSHNAWSQGRYYMPGAASLPQSPQFHTIPNASIVAAGVQQHGDVPDLARRNSLSSNEEYGPRTPFFAAQNLGGATKLIVPDNSPQTWNSPSTHQFGQSGSGSPQQLWREGNGYIVVDYDALCTTAPAIPRPIPAIFSGDKSRGTLETSLENKNKTTNVYIRGLHPNTTDEMLNAYGSRFGVIDSAKSMIDQNTGLCKGFGFIKYQAYKDGENCIRGFYHWGYEAKWARDSHNDKLKKLGDEANTNLYISNIPVDLDFNEHSLMDIFSKHDCLSAKILRDNNGLSRGVGFARFASPEVCLSIIQEYNGQPVGAQGQPISIRFADTPRQKDLKAITHERRQYKTHEYNMAAFGPDSPYRHMGPMVAALAAQSPIQQHRPHLVHPSGAQPWIVPQSPYAVSFPVNAVPMVSAAPAVVQDTQPLDQTPLAGRTAPRMTPYQVTLNAARTELAEGESKIKNEDTQSEESTALSNRNTNLPTPAAVEHPVKSYRHRENGSAHGSAISSPAKVTPKKQSVNAK